jgi:hypothetical protein
MSLNLSTNCYYALFSQQHLGKNTESWKWSVYRLFVGIPTTVAALAITLDNLSLGLSTFWRLRNVHCSFSDKNVLAAVESCAEAQKIHGLTV